QIEIKASKKIVLTAGGSQIEISGAGVLPTTAGKFESKAGQHQFLGGGRIEDSFMILPDLRSKKFHRRFLFHDEISSQPLSYYKYRVKNKTTNEILQGITNIDGLTEIITTTEDTDLEVLIGNDEVDEILKKIKGE
ncbi:DUF2345 domain-containing protein, partial [Acinetobacter johnsonii]